MVRFSTFQIDNASLFTLVQLHRCFATDAGCGRSLGNLNILNWSGYVVCYEGLLRHRIVIHDILE